MRMNKAGRIRRLALLACCALALAACNAIATPTPAPLVDSVFSGYAFLDANGNGHVDAGDTPLKDAVFIVQLKAGAEFGGVTDAEGYAFILVPGGVQYPVVLRMEPPKGSTYTLVGPSSIVRNSAAGEKAEFLFRSK